jgi:signal transduction histidine kinase
MKRRWPAGLRWRFLLALLATSVLTLGTAAAVVLQPLSERLRDQSVDSLQAAVTEHVSEFEAVFAEHKKASLATIANDPDLFTAASALSAQTDGRVLVADDTTMPVSELDSPPDFIYDSDFSVKPARAMHMALRALLERQMVTELDGDDLLVGTPLYVDGRPTAMLVAERRLSEVSQLVAQVRNRFLIAAVIGLAVAVLLAVALSSTLLRRLGRLRAVAVRIANEGPDAPTPHDERRDEVGDLARALARMQEELRRQEAARRAFVSTASHELRTPLTMLQGTMELLEEDLRADQLDEEDALLQVDTARQQLNRLSVLAGELLDLSRLDAAVPLRSEAVELGELARAVAAEFELRARERATAIEVALPEGACWGRGDPDAIARVVRILIDNALAYGPRGEPIRVETREGGGAATLAVADKGPGIPEAEHERIFERFNRGAAASSSGGFGLGLAIGRELARRMGGELELQDGPGTRFVLRLHGASARANAARADRDRVSA